jgi:hypothetical protein
VILGKAVEPPKCKLFLEKKLQRVTISLEIMLQKQRKECKITLHLNIALPATPL